MRGFRPVWFVVGGWAIDLFLSEVTRTHEDVEVGVFREDQVALQEHLGGWSLQKVSGGETSVWSPGERLEPPVHEIHCYRETAEPSHFEVLLNESAGGDWVYRRDRRVRRPLDTCILTSDDGVPFLCPEAVLLYKSKSPRAKDEQDFASVAGRLGGERREWLMKVLLTCYPDHHWLRIL